ncbi:MAG TPA: hypothetical protein VEW03_11620 [Longimicrobiaceae bacterium]|nr:hypothetical protein [Longimicrobiaceae bacterium]
MRYEDGRGPAAKSLAAAGVALAAGAAAYYLARIVLGRRAVSTARPPAAGRPLAAAATAGE